MGLLDKVKESAKKFKEDNRNFGTTFKRINSSSCYGNINFSYDGIKKVPDNLDFHALSYISDDGANWVIYGSSQDDYFFKVDDVKTIIYDNVYRFKSFKKNDEIVPLYRYKMFFNDGKTAIADIYENKDADFIKYFKTKIEMK